MISSASISLSYGDDRLVDAGKGEEWWRLG